LLPGLGEGKPVKGVLVPRTPRLEGLKGDEGLESKEDEILKFQCDEPKVGIEWFTLTHWEGDKKLPRILKGSIPWTLQEIHFGGDIILKSKYIS